jgi:signal transduction histidine kinase/CheY-like chemotaxis protein
VGRRSRLFDATLDVPVGAERPASLLQTTVAQRRVWRGDVRANVRGRTLLLSVSAAPVLDDAGAVVRVVVLRRDVTMLHRTLGDRAERERLASLGTLAAGLAHEFNNPLACVQANLTLAREQLADAASGEVAALDALLRDADDATERLRRLAGDLRMLSRPVGDPASRSDAGVAVVRRCLEQSVRLAGARIRSVACSEIVAPPMLTARIDPARLGQVLLNLLINATQAMPQGESHLRRIRLECEPDPDAPASFLLVRVADNGTGMAPDVLQRAFEPFFTTKAPGEGTGLGLPICRQLVREAGGSLTCTSEVGRGTTMSIRVPRGQDVALAPSGDAGLPAVTEPAAARVHGATTGGLLLVDDDPLVARSLRRMLRGIDVRIASSAEDALEVLEEGAGYSCVVTDLVMPGLSGVDLFDRLRRRWPQLEDRVVFVTGGDRTMALRAEAERTGRPVLEKPVSPREFRETVRTVGGLP